MSLLLKKFGFYIIVSVIILCQGVLSLLACPTNRLKYTDFIIYFFVLSAFFWLNVMCFDIWWVFSGKRGQRLIIDNLSNHKRFLKYSAYATGIPAALTALLAILEYSGLPKHPLLPNILDGGCFMTGNTILLYLYLPLMIPLVANLILFILTALNIAKTRRQTKQMMSSSDNSLNNQHKKETYRFVLYVKLFSLTGFTWIFEVISAYYPEGENIWKFTDAYNVLFGVLIFVIFICKKSVLTMIIKRYNALKNSSDSQGQQSSTTVISM